MRKNEDNWLSNYEAVKAHVTETGHFPDKHTIGNNWVRYQRKCIKASTLEDWKRVLFEELAASRNNCHIGGRRKQI